jgi:D-galactarolactone cycloisomerase
MLNAVIGGPAVKITAIHVYPLRVELRAPFAFSQWTFRHRETTLVSVDTDEGLTGWGEAYGPASPNAAAVRDFFAPQLAGRDPRDTEALWHFLFARSIDYGQKGTMVAAISALDIAFWDIKARAAGVPLYRLLGGAEIESIPCYATGFYFGDQNLERQFVREAEGYLAEGFTALKMKVGLGVERDAVLVAAVRRAIGPDARLMIDANHAYSAVDAVALGRLVEPHRITWFEEPVSPLDVSGYLEVKRRISIPLAGGECEYTRFGFEPLLRRRAVDYAQPDLCSCGGVSEGMKIATLASIYGVHVTPHAWGSAVGQAAALHFYAALSGPPATLLRAEKLLECDRTENPLRTEIADSPIRFHAGRLFLPETGGLGIEVREEKLKQYRLE